MEPQPYANTGDWLIAKEMKISDAIYHSTWLGNYCSFSKLPSL